jgi:hypothetical protein
MKIIFANMQMQQLATTERQSCRYNRSRSHIYSRNLSSYDFTYTMVYMYLHAGDSFIGGFLAGLTNGFIYEV